MAADDTKSPEITPRGGWLRNLLDRAVAELAFAVMALIKRIPVEWSFRIMDRAARLIGPRLGRHRLVRHNLARAFPELDDAQRETIALDAWGSMGRMLVEYVYIDALFDLDADRPEGGRVEVVGAEHIRAAKDSGRPVIFFTAHLGAFEMLPLVAATYGFSPAILFRPPNNPYLARRVDHFRRARMGHLVPSHAGSSLTLARVLAAGGSVGILVDQKYPTGLSTTFFGQAVHTNPLVPKLARQFDPVMIGSRCQRLPGDRYRVTIEPPADMPRGPDGRIDPDLAAQAINDRVEAWVRQAPGQWLWYHDRWNIKRSL